MDAVLFRGFTVLRSASAQLGSASRRIAIVSAFAALLIGCASAPPEDDPEAVAAYQEANDPLEPLNRYLFEVNLGVDKLLVRPFAEVYRGALPVPVRNGVRNFINNYDTPVIFVNDVLQWEIDRAGDSFGRFTTNTFFGVAGVFDVAAGDKNAPPENGIVYHDEDLGQTLAVWGVGEGPYLMIPLLGPSNVRDAVGRVGDAFLNPLDYVPKRKNRLGWFVIRRSLDALDTRSRNIETLDDVERSAIDYYATVRSLYRQSRASEISNGRLPDTPLPSLSDFELDDEDDELSLAEPSVTESTE